MDLDHVELRGTRGEVLDLRQAVNHFFPHTHLEGHRLMAVRLQGKSINGKAFVELHAGMLVTDGLLVGQEDFNEVLLSLSQWSSSPKWEIVPRGDIVLKEISVHLSAKEESSWKNQLRAPWIKGGGKVDLQVDLSGVHRIELTGRKRRARIYQFWVITKKGEKVRVPEIEGWVHAEHSRYSHFNRLLDVDKFQILIEGFEQKDAQVEIRVY